MFDEISQAVLAREDVLKYPREQVSAYLEELHTTQRHKFYRALQHRLNELGYELTGAELDVVYHRFTQLADRKKSIYDQDLLSLVPVTARERATAHAAS